MKTFRSTRRKHAGFTLLEILVVILIIGLLVGVVGTNVWNALIRGQKGTVKIQIKNLEEALQQYQLDHYKFPDDLRVLEEPNTETGKPYLDGKVPLDPWNNEYGYEILADGNYLITSFGKDGEAGGEGENADISNESIDGEA